MSESHVQRIKGNSFINSLKKIGAFDKKIQMINLMDSEHYNPAIYGIVTNRESIKELSKAGVKHIFIESDRELQSLVDNYFKSEGRIAKMMDTAMEEKLKNLDGSVKGFQRVSEFLLLRNAKKFNIKVHFADHKRAMRSFEENEPEMTGLYRALTNKRLKVSDLNEATLIRYEEFYDRLYSHRKAMNNEIAEYVKTRAKDRNSRTEKSVLIFGDAHSCVSENGFDILFGQDKTITVLLIDSKEPLKQANIPAIKQVYETGGYKRKPDAVYF